MAMFTVPFDDFGGLDLTSAVNETGGCIDCLNVEFDKPGRVRSRDGFAQVADTGVGTSRLGLLMPLLKAASNTTVPALSVYVQAQVFPGPVNHVYNALTGADLGNHGLTHDQSNFARFGTPTTDLLYWAGDAATRGVSTTRGTVQKYDGTTFSSGVGKPMYVGVTPWDNRLVEAGFDTTADPSGGTNASQSTVFFSDAGLPDTFSANNFIHLHPGDGERITGVCSWRNFLIVAKETRIFVFYGTSTDSVGNPIFNYRTVSLPAAIPEESNRAIVAGDTAFYLMTSDGIYVSTGGPPTRISQAIDPALYGPVPATWADYTTAPTLTGLSYANNRLWVHVITSSANRSFILDFKTSQWTYSTIGTYVLADGTGSGVYFLGSGTDHQTLGVVYHQTPSATTDAGSGITSRCRSGYIPLDWRGRTIRSGIHGVDKTVRESLLEGSGTVTYALANQWSNTMPAGSSVVLGVSPQVQMGRDRTAVRGRMFSWRISATAAWSLETLSWNVHGYQDPGEQSETI